MDKITRQCQIELTAFNTISSLASEEDVTITVAPEAFASWIAKLLSYEEEWEGRSQAYKWEIYIIEECTYIATPPVLRTRTVSPALRGRPLPVRAL